MKSTERILEFIAKGDAVEILAESDLTDNLNKLLIFGFIDIIGDKIMITSKGEEARKEGFEKVLLQLRSEDI